MEAQTSWVLRSWSIIIQNRRVCFNSQNIIAKKTMHVYTNYTHAHFQIISYLFHMIMISHRTVEYVD